jgi:hypothetical protein
MLLAAIGGALLLIPAVRAQQVPGPLVREGSHWVETTRLITMVPMGGQLVVDTLGNLSVSGGGGGQVIASLRKRVRAATENEARRLLSLCEIRTRRMGGDVVITVRAPGYAPVLTDLDVEAPRDVRRVSAQSAGGSLRFNGLRADVSAVTAGGPIHADGITGTLDVRTGGGNVEIGTVSASARVFTAGGPIQAGRIGGNARLETGGGQIVVEQAGSMVEAVTRAGNIRVGKAGGQVVARTGGGAIRVEEAAGEVHAESVAGRIEIDAARGVQCQAAAGPIQLRNVTGRMRAITASGSIRAELDSGRELADSLISSNNGDIIVVVPSNLAVTVEAWNESPGRLRQIVSDFAEIRVLAPEIGRQYRTVAAGALNGGGPLLRIAAVGGTIYLRRQE